MPNNDYILRADALKAVCENCSMHGDEGEPCSSRCEDYALVLKIPAADVVPVVRCANCQYFEIVEYWPDGTKKVCRLLNKQVNENVFCSFGCRKEKAE